MVAGVVSNVPGGLGVFETVILFLLSPQVSAATGLLGFHEICQRFKSDQL
ncbi:hypothetical protein [Chroococcidiopsis sp. CCMEE 29]|nr:hypothetical protein [Chroococcidiopsis sp. CCMEE 29]